MSQWGDLNSFRVTHLLWMVVWACGGGNALSDSPSPAPAVGPGSGGWAGDCQVPGLAHVGGSTWVPQRSPCLGLSVH